jgi:flagellar biosynthetic protein FliR
MTLSELITGNLFAFLLVFTRIGTAFMVMPGIGDTLVSPNIRLLFALAVSFIMTPILKIHLPAIPADATALALLLCLELVVGLFIGTVMRLMIAAMETTGMVIALQSGLSNALLFNPAIGAQGSAFGIMLTMMAVTLLMVTNLHHLMLGAVFDSYNLISAKSLSLDTASLSLIITKIVSASFNIGVQLSIPFIILGLASYYAFGVLGKLLPQIQFFVLAIPAQILMSFVTMALVISAIAYTFLAWFETTLIQTLIR